MPVVGFIDDAGKRIKFADIDKGKGFFELPRPFLRAMAAGYRPANHYGDTDVVSVTTLANPVQQVRLLQRNDVYVAPLSSWQAQLGTFAHAGLEAHVDNSVEVAERRLVIDFEGQLVGGTFDLLEREAGEWIGRDYKIIGAYAVSKMVTDGVAKGKIEYALQGNVYRYMIGRPDVREVVQTDDGPVLVPFEHAGLQVSRWQLVCWARDWSASKRAGTIKPVEMLDVDLIAPERVENYLRQRIAVYAASGMCDDAGLPECTRDETWNGRRCASWCDAASVCKQFGARKGWRAKS